MYNLGMEIIPRQWLILYRIISKHIDDDIDASPENKKKKSFSENVNENKLCFTQMHNNRRERLDNLNGENAWK